MTSSSDPACVRASLRMAIEAGEGEVIRAGRLLPERALMARFGVGRRMVRAVLAELEAEGLVYRRQGQGTFLSPTRAPGAGRGALASHTSPRDIVEARLEIEPMLARLAATRATPADIERLKQLVARARDARTGSQYERFDSAFHAAIAQSVRNELLRGVFELVNGVRAEDAWLSAREITFSLALREELLRQHDDIVAALEARDPQAAETAMRAHLRTAGERLTDA
ncbi:GntR family transcriptional repressor for pyruvate dehydrogenase complex [Pseudochelatococcus lubricantis]|uniref:GntR family transcriptional repressor for pyruvate dehydrogenase complex n=1 Tax=Pseudochelatococcus lubricantis TaxID=1538102 RepID=A0ABX0UXC6_9HYPH|nr:FCD domain-containing protein [Pseudochelatococcus lubricantis]NIJ57058.1 GntR family transcriptional repressor for pyruvate dehydrogenase complex [Pseudochelatococcus lubricantis]